MGTKQNLSKLLAELHSFTFVFRNRCGCGSDITYVKYNYIKKDNTWDYSIMCSICGNERG